MSLVPGFNNIALDDLATVISIVILVFIAVFVLCYHEHAYYTLFDKMAYYDLNSKKFFY